MPSITHVIVDFDGTCTTFDTTPLIPHLTSPTTESLKEFAAFEQVFVDRSLACQASLDLDGVPSPGPDIPGLERALAALDDVSNDVIEQVSAKGVLAGMEEGAVAATIAAWRAEPSSSPGALPAVRPGVEATLADALTGGSKLAVLTLNWCPPLLHALLPVLQHKDVQMFSNDIDAAGVIQNKIRGALDKRAVISQIIAEARKEDAEPSVLYVGDSSTDLLALLEADVGILIGESNSARKIARRFGLQLQPLPDEGFAARALVS